MGLQENSAGCSTKGAQLSGGQVKNSATNTPVACMRSQVVAHAVHARAAAVQCTGGGTSMCLLISSGICIFQNNHIYLSRFSHFNYLDGLMTNLSKVIDELIDTNWLVCVHTVCILTSGVKLRI